MKYLFISMMIIGCSLSNGTPIEKQIEKTVKKDTSAETTIPDTNYCTSTYQADCINPCKRELDFWINCLDLFPNKDLYSWMVDICDDDWDNYWQCLQDHDVSTEQEEA